MSTQTRTTRQVNHSLYGAEMVAKSEPIGTYNKSWIGCNGNLRDADPELMRRFVLYNVTKSKG